MRAEEILLNYQRKGVQLYINEMKLCYRAPKSILSKEDKELLRENKTLIIEYLKKHAVSNIIEG